MVKWQGFACAAAAAIGHSGIDATRKYASQTLSSAELVTLVGILDALFLSSFIFAFRLVTDLRFVTWKLLQILVASSAAKILAGVMYQRALHVAPISTTVPFLAFVPVLLLATSFLLLGEVPSVQGVVGVVVVTAGGYLLALQSSSSSGGGSRGPSRASSRASSPRPGVAAVGSGSSYNESEVLGDKIKASGTITPTDDNGADVEARITRTDSAGAGSQAGAEPSSPVTPNLAKPRSSILRGNHPVPFSAPPINRTVARRLTGNNHPGINGATDTIESPYGVTDLRQNSDTSFGVGSDAGLESPDLRAEADSVLGSDIALDLSFGQDIKRAVSERSGGGGGRAGRRGGQEVGEVREEEDAGGGASGSAARERSGESRQRSFTEGPSSSDIGAGGGFGGGRGFYSRASRGRFGTGLGIGLGSAHSPQQLHASAQSSPATSGGREMKRKGEARGEEGEIVGTMEQGRGSGGGGEGEKGESSKQQQAATPQQGATPTAGGVPWRTRSGRRRGAWGGGWLSLLQQVWGAVVGGKEERDGEAGRRGWVKLLISRMARVRLLLGGLLAPLGKRAGIVWQYLHGPLKRLRMVTAWARAPLRVVLRVLRAPWVVLKGALRWVGAQKRHEGPLLMMGCAVLLSFTNGCDKLGVHHSPSVVVFAGLQRLFMAVPPVLYLAATRPSAFPLLLHHFPLLAGISAFEITAIVFYLQSLHWLLVSYSVAAKRSNILISMFVGYFLFKENIWRRLPYVLLMISGMTLIIFAA